MESSGCASRITAWPALPSSSRRTVDQLRRISAHSEAAASGRVRALRPAGPGTDQKRAEVRRTDTVSTGCWRVAARACQDLGVDRAADARSARPAPEALAD